MEKIANIQPKEIKLFHLILFVGLGGIVLAVLMGYLSLLGMIISLPLMFIMLVLVIKNPIILFYVIFTLNYFLMGISRYIVIDGISVFMDVLIISTLLLIIVHSRLYNNIDWRATKHILTYWAVLWMLYCIMEVINPSGVFKGWLLSRGLIFNAFLITVITSLLCNKFKIVSILLFMLSIFSVLAVIKALMQKYMGFDMAEIQWLNKEAASTHLIRWGTRYFSFFTDAGNFGSNMGYSGIVFIIVAFFIQNKFLKVYYLLVGIASLYAMVMSGTRGAIIVPLGGIALLSVISKNVKVMVSGGLALVLIYVFFVFTNIGQGNAQIRRVRTAFTPSKDASYNVRRENQRKLALHLKNKPFGEGLGLSGGENRHISNRFTTNVPNDSWYVKIWVETGIVGVILYVGGLFVVIGRGAWILMFKIRNREVKGLLSAMLCGVFGLLLSAYGNPFWGQFPTTIIVFVTLTLVLRGESLERDFERSEDLVKRTTV